eukprot:sb/3478466/
MCHGKQCLTIIPMSSWKAWSEKRLKLMEFLLKIMIRLKSLMTETEVFMQTWKITVGTRMGKGHRVPNDLFNLFKWSVDEVHAQSEDVRWYASKMQRFSVL